jgi:hypothetical protein
MADGVKVPRVVIIVDGGVVTKVAADSDVSFVVLDLDLLNDEDPIGLAQLTRTVPEQHSAGHTDPDKDVAEYCKQAKRQLRRLTE